MLESLPLLVGARLATGVGEALWFVRAATIVNDLAPAERRGEALSYFTLAAYGGLAIGPLAGDLLLSGSRFDLVFAVAALCAAAACALSFQVGETRPAGAPRSTGPLVYRGAIAPGLVLVSGLFAFGGFNAFVALYALEIGLERTGLVFALFAVIVIGVRLFGARLPDRLGARRAGLLALAGIATGMAIVAAWHDVPGLLLGTVVFSFGQALAFPAMMTLTVSGAPESERGAAVGTISAFVDVSLVAGAVGLGFVADATSYRGAFATGALVALFGIALLARLSETPATLGARIGNPADPVR